MAKYGGSTGHHRDEIDISGDGKHRKEGGRSSARWMYEEREGWWMMI